MPNITVSHGLTVMGKLVLMLGDLGQRFLTGVQAQLAPCQLRLRVTVTPAEVDLVHCLPWGALQDAEKGLQSGCQGRMAWSSGHRHPSWEGAGWHELCWSHRELLEPQSTLRLCSEPSRCMLAARGQQRPRSHCCQFLGVALGVHLILKCRGERSHPPLHNTCCR